MRRILAATSLVLAVGLVAGDGVAQAQNSPPHVPLRECFAHPGACGYPDPAYRNVGATSSCRSLPQTGPLTVRRDGAMVSHVRVSGGIAVYGSRVTIDDVCVVSNGGGKIGSIAISIHGSDDVIEHSTISGQGVSIRSVDTAVIDYGGAGARLSRDEIVHCGDCVMYGPWRITDSYIDADGMQNTADHTEDVYCNDQSVSITHDTMLNPENQTAVVFCNTENGGSYSGPCQNSVTIKNSMLAGGGFLIYACGNASSPGSSVMNVSGNVFARCRTPPFAYNHVTGGTTCRGTQSDAAFAGSDAFGFWPHGGYYGVDSGTFCPPLSGQVWTDNVWDAGGGSARC